jgi:hypothetical protein
LRNGRWAGILPALLAHLYGQGGAAGARFRPWCRGCARSMPSARSGQPARLVHVDRLTAAVFAWFGTATQLHLSGQRHGPGAAAGRAPLFQPQWLVLRWFAMSPAADTARR